MITERLKHGLMNMAPVQSLSLTNPADWRIGRPSGTSRTGAMKLSAVNCCVEVISNTVAKIPAFVMTQDKTRPAHPLNKLLHDRVNEAMTRFDYEKLTEANRLLRGNAYTLIVRDRDARPRELIPLPPDYVQEFFDEAGALWYVYTHPKSGEIRRFSSADILHYKAYSEDGVTGISVLRRAADVIASGRAAQEYDARFYEQNAQVPGVLTVEADLKPDTRTKIRNEWERIHKGVDNAFRIAILDNGLKYQPISLSNRDAQFVENKAITVEDIGRFFGVPLYKLNAGKQSYASNEQNAIEFLSGTIHPIVSQREQEDTYKLLAESESAKGLRVHRNMMAELRGDSAARANWYKAMREIGAYSANDIRDLEDLPGVAGGDSRYASLNYVPLASFERLADQRNGGEKR